MTAAALAIAGAVVLLVPTAAVRRFARAAAAAVAGVVLAWVLCPVPVVMVAAAIAASVVPTWLRRRREAAMRQRVRSQWPEAIDTIRGEVRSGATVAEAVAAPARRLPGAQEQSDLTERFDDYRRRLSSGELFESAVSALRRPDDPVADRVVAVLQLAADVGSADVGRVLAALSAFLRADLAQDREIAARQQWNVSAAGVAVAAPWLTVALLSVQPDARAAYSSTAGAVLLGVVAVVSVVAYVLMKRAAEVAS